MRDRVNNAGGRTNTLEGPARCRWGVKSWIPRERGRTLKQRSAARFDPMESRLLRDIRTSYHAPATRDRTGLCLGVAPDLPTLADLRRPGRVRGDPAGRAKLRLDEGSRRSHLVVPTAGPRRRDLLHRDRLRAARR